MRESSWSSLKPQVSLLTYLSLVMGLSSGTSGCRRSNNVARHPHWSVSFLFSWNFGFISRKIPSSSKGRKLPAAQIYIHTIYNSKERAVLSLSFHLSSHMEGLLLVLSEAHVPTSGWITEVQRMWFSDWPRLEYMRTSEGRDKIDLPDDYPSNFSWSESQS